MIADLEPYPNYKDSGVPWLGEMPEHWNLRRLKRCALLNPSKRKALLSARADMPVSFLPMECVGTEGAVDMRQFRPASTVWNGFTYFQRGDVIVAKITPCFENGKGAYLKSLPSEIGFGSTEFHVLRARSSILPAYLYRITTVAEFRQLGADAMTGAAGQQRVPQEFMANYLVALPPLLEQSCIVRFLDHVDRHTRHYIRAKQKLVKLLEEKKQVIIHRAVTRGLDPNARLKPSGIEWLGNIPEHWELRRNGRLFIQRNETGHSELPILEVSLKTGVRIRNFEASDRKQIMTDREKYKRAAKGDIAYNMMRMWQGAIGIVPNDGLVSPAYVVAKPLKGIEPRYFSSLFHTREYMGEVDKCSRGIVKDRNRLYWEDFKQMQSTRPPLDEQIAIADFIDECTATLDKAMQRIFHGISFLQEYRTRLISDVVTGKLDVRGIELPATAEEAAEEPEDWGEGDVSETEELTDLWEVADESD